MNPAHVTVGALHFSRRARIGDAVRILLETRTPSGPAISPGGEWIAFPVEVYGKSLLHAMRSGGTDGRHLVLERVQQHADVVMLDLASR